MNLTRKVLFVTYSFPPEAEVGGKRTARFCRYLPEFGIHPVVLTVDPRYYTTVDPSYAAAADIEVIRTNCLSNPLDWYGKLAARWRRGQDSTPPGANVDASPGDSQNSGFIHGMRRNLLVTLQTPDRYWGWYWPAVRAGINFVRRCKPEAIVSSGPPWTSHLVARGIHRRAGVPWIADFRDPWTLSPWRETLPGWIERFERHLERSVIEEAARVVCVASEIADDFREKYRTVSPDKFVTITNGIEGDFDLPMPKVPNTRRSVLHLGSLYGDRRIQPFLEAVVKLARTGAVNLEGLRFLFVGLIDPQIARQASQEISYLEQFGAIEFRTLVPYEQGQRLLASSDLLLLFQGNNRVTIPAKLFEYLTTGKPILAIARPGSVTRLVSESNLGLWVDSANVAAIAAELLKCLSLPPRTAEQHNQIVQRFHFRTLTKQLIEILQEARHSCAS